MKKILILLLCFVAVSLSQNQLFSKMVKAKSYANSQNDTTQALDVGKYYRCSLYITTLDCVSISKIYIDNRHLGSSTWNAKLDSASTAAISSTANGGYQYEWVFRDGDLDKSNSVSGAIRFRINFASSANGTSTATYKAYLYWVDNK